ncbi:MAG: peptidoglycan bridge formation glycyltransferase FemA/FemB family protein [Patescibacteria group bacterium]
MEIKNLKDEERGLYSDFLFNSKYKDILQSWEWGDVKSKFNWKAERLGFFKDGKLIGVAQILERRLPLGFSIFYMPRGPIFDWEDKELIKKAIPLLAKEIREKAKTKKTLFLRLEPPIKKDEDIELLFKEQGFNKYFKTVQPPSTLLIDLSPAEEELFKNLRRTARNLINRSEKEGLSVDVLTGDQITENHLKSFYNLYRITGKRFSFPLRPYRQFSTIAGEMSEGGRIRFYLAKVKGLTLAYGIVLLSKDKAFYIWGGTVRHPDYSKFLNYGYIWGMLRDLKKTGVKVFDFWGLGPENDKNHPWQGFSLFKTAFGGERFDYIGAFDLPLSRFYNLFRLADRILTPKYRATSS